MQSSNLPPDYPTTDNLFNKFFKLINSISSSVNAEILRKNAPKIKKYKDLHTIHAHFFANDAIATSQCPPTSSQNELFNAEQVMLAFLQLLYDHKAKVLGEPIKKSEADIVNGFKMLCDVQESRTAAAEPVAAALLSLLIIASEIIIFNEPVTELTDIKVDNLISTALLMKERIGKYKCTYEKLLTHNIANVYAAIADDLKSFIHFVIYDKTPDTPSQKFAAFLADTFVKKLLALHKQLERKMKQAHGYPTAAFEHYVTCIRLIHVDSITRRLNMEKSMDERNLFIKQQIKYNQNKYRLDFTLWCNTMVVEDLFQYLDGVVRGIYIHLEKLHDFDSRLRTLTTGNMKYNKDFDKLLMHRAENYIFNGRLLQQYLMELNNNQLEKEDPVTYAKRLGRYKELRMSIQLVLNTLVARLYGMRLARGQKISVNDWTESIHKNIVCLSTDVIDFRDYISDLATCDTALLFDIAAGLRFASADVGLERENIASQLASNIIAILEHREMVNDALTQIQKIYARQFILDCYYGYVLQCTTPAESAMLIKKTLHDIIKLQLNDKEQGFNLPNLPVYVAIDHFILRYKRAGLALKEIDDDYFATYTLAEIAEFCNLCAASIKKLANSKFRMSISLRIFFIKYATQFLEYLVNKGTAQEKVRAKGILNDFANLYKSEKKSTTEYFDKMIELKIIHEPVRFLPNDSFVPAGKVETPKPKIPKKKKNKGGSAPSIALPAKSTFNALAPYEKNVEALENDMDAVLDAYQALPLQSKNRNRNLHVLLGLAEHLVNMSGDTRARETLIGKLEKNCDTIFHECRSILLTGEIAKQRLRYDELLAPYRKKPPVLEVTTHKTVKVGREELPPFEPVVSSVSLFKSSERTEAQRKFRNRYHFTDNEKQMRQAPVVSPTVPNVWKMRALAQIAATEFLSPCLPETKIQQVLIVTASPEAVSKTLVVSHPFANLYGELFLHFKRNAVQLNVVRLLHENGMFPYYHGGKVVYAALLHEDIEIKPEPDLDMGCFPIDNVTLYQLFVSHQEQLGIQDLAKDIWHDVKNNVYILTLHDKINHETTEKIEIAYTPVTSINEIPAKLTLKAEGFGTNTTGYCDAMTMRIMYPTKQLRLFIEKRIIDVAWDEGKDRSAADIVLAINDYLQKYPQRSMDIIDRLAKLGHYGCQLIVSRRIKDALLINRPALSQHLNQITKFDKLFLQGYAVDTFSILSQLKMLNTIFPMLMKHHVTNFYKACVAMDIIIHGYPHAKLTPESLIAYRSLFLAQSLYVGFMERPVTLDVKDVSEFVFADCFKYLKRARFFLSEEYLDFKALHTHVFTFIKKHSAYEFVHDYIDEKGNIAADCICIFTGALIVNPVFCTLDCRTYEEVQIRVWLANNKCSPVNGRVLLPWQTIDDVLMPHEEIRAAVDIYLSLLETENHSSAQLEYRTLTQ